MVAFAFLALGFSDALQLPIVLISALGISASWFAEAPRYHPEKHRALWTTVLAIGFAYTVASIVLGQEAMIAAGYLLPLMLVAKLFQRHQSKDYQQIHVLAFLMLVLGTVLNPSLSYGLFFFGFVITSTWALTLFHLRRQIEDSLLTRNLSDSQTKSSLDRILNSKRIVSRRFFTGTSILSIVVFVASTFLFLLIPRVGMGFFLQKSRSSVSMAGFSDSVKLGGHGRIRNDDRVVMRVKLKGISQSQIPAIHWRGVAFDTYQDAQWSRSFSAPKTRRRIEIKKNFTRHHLLYQNRRSPIKELPLGEVRQDIYLEPTGYNVLFGASMPTAFEFGKTIIDKSKSDRNDEIRYNHKAGLKYTVYSTLGEPSSSARQTAVEPLSADARQVYLQLPSGLPPAIQDLAKRITQGKNTSLAKSKAIRDWLGSELQYSRDMVSSGDIDPLEFFLFDRKKGHCEYFSSAMAILARAAGLPSRNVNGFLGGEWNEYDDYLAVRAGDAHSWTEVFIDDIGWMTFDATPTAGVAFGGGASMSFVDKMRRLADTMRFKWFKWVIEYDLYRQISIVKNLGNRFGGGNKSTDSKEVKPKQRRKVPYRFLIGIALVLFAVGFGIWSKKKSALANGAGVFKRRTEIAKLYNQLLSELTRAGHLRLPANTPREFAMALCLEDHIWSEDFATLTELYYRCEYGAGPKNNDLEFATELFSKIRAHLLANAKMA